MNVQAPNEQWRSRQAWLFVFLTFVITQVISGGLLLLAINFSQIARFLQSPIGSALVSVAGLIFLLAITLLVAKVSRISQFKLAFAFVHPSEKELLVSIGLGIFLQCAGIYFSSGDLTHLRLSHSISVGTLVVLLAPFFEEPAMRGFLFKAFRNSYPLIPSIGLTTGASLLFHWGEIYHSFDALIVISLLNIVLCLIRERTRSLWNCVACHLAFNSIFAAIQQ
jgi:membrane protease YdiL (CAAX protease family)